MITSRVRDHITALGPGELPVHVYDLSALRKHATEVRAALPADVELYYAAKANPEPGILAALATVVTGYEVSSGGELTPFGIDPARIDACLALLAAPECHRLRLRGIHAHLASGLDAASQLTVAQRIVDWTMRLAQRHHIRLDEVNVGGGMAVDYADPAARFDWTAFGAGLARIQGRHPGLRLRIEPGRALTAYCGWYATEVLDVKHSHGEEFAVLRGGTHHLRTPAARSHNQPFTVLPVDAWPHPWPRPAATADAITLAGQLCTPKDILARHAPAPGLRAGDRVAFAMAGAYAWNISHHSFLMHPRPGVHLLT